MGHPQAAEGPGRATGWSARAPWLLGWGLAAAILVFGFGAPALRQQFSEPDNAMRLVEVRDWLGGQGWFDMVQPRLNPPDGVLMHWARWVDAGIAAPIALLTPLVGAHQAEIAASFIWPLTWLALFMVLTTRVSGEMGAREGLRTPASFAGAIIAALAFPAVEKFAPGAFDHHNIELTMAMAAMLGLMRMETSPRWGGFAGAALGVAMATAAEALPLVIAGLLAAGLLWLFRPQVYGRGLAWLGGGLATASLVGFFALVPPARWAAPVCDTMSESFLGMGLTGGAIAIALGAGPGSLIGRTLVRRLAVAAGLGVAGLLVLVVLFPECAGGGYSALGADMITLWMAQISETRSLADLTGGDRGMILAIAGAPASAIVIAVVYLRTRWRTPEGWIVLAFLAAAWAVLAWQIRGAAFANAFAIPFAAWAVARMHQASRRSPSWQTTLAYVCVLACSAGGMWAAAGVQLQTIVTPQTVHANFEARRASANDCSRPEAYASLAQIPAGVMLNHFSLGADLLQLTHHSAMAAPYHRDAAGTMLMINAMRSTPFAARAIIANSAADYVLVCPALSETAFYATHPAAADTAPEATLSMQLADGKPPAWLQPVELSGSPLKLYRILRPTTPSSGPQPGR